MLRVIAGLAFSALSHFRGAWTGLAVVPFPGSLNIGGASAPVGSPPTVSAHDGMLTALVLAIEIALFVLVPIYLRSRRRAQIRSAIRITYDSRRDPNATRIADIQPAPAAAWKDDTRRARLHLVGGWGQRRVLRQS